MDKQINILDELSRNFIDFSYEANSCRAFADARDGLKPGQRACLWEMYDKGYFSNKPHVKSAKIDGGVVSNWWPHGTTAIYETFARMSQKWINNIPEVDWHGENGSQIISAEPAADRYTEARLSKAAEEGLLAGIKKNNVPMISNFSEDAQWPAVLPGLFPRLLVNGCQGIGVTIANVWLPHCLKEVTQVIQHYIETGELDTSNLYPSFPSGGIIINKDDIHNIYETGKGKVVLRAKTEIQDNTIVITELPYQVYVEPLVDQIKKLVKDEELTGIKEVYNKSGKKGLRVDIECSDNPVMVLKTLFQKTDLQKSFSANQWALVGKTPKLLNLREYLDIYIEHNVSCIRREYEFDLSKAKNRLEIVEGLIKALAKIDDIISLIKKSESSAAAKETLMKEYGFTENQAKAIVNMRLGSLSRLEGVELNQEKEELEANVAKWEEIISSAAALKERFLSRLVEFTNKYGDSRKSEVIHITPDPKAKKEVPVKEPEDVVVLITNTGAAKRVARKSFKVQKRNTVGVKTNGDIIAFSAGTNTADTLLIFTTKGKMYRLLVEKIPEGSNTSNGTFLSNLIEFDKDESPVAYTTVNLDTPNKYLFFATKNGVVKKVPIEEYLNTKRSGVIAISFKDGDELATATFINKEDMMLVTKNGMTIRFQTDGMPISSRTAQGVKGMNVNEGDSIIAVLPLVNYGEHTCLAVVSSNGQGKKVPLSEFTTQNRGGKGVSCYKGELAGATLVADDNSVLVTGNKSSIVISSNELPNLGRASAGNIVIKNNDKVISISRI